MSKNHANARTRCSWSFPPLYLHLHPLSRHSESMSHPDGLVARSPSSDLRLIHIAFVLTIVYAATGILVTALRLAVRGRDKWGVDDLYAVLAAGSLAMIAIVFGIRLQAVSFLAKHLKLAIALFYVNGMAFPLVVWFARLSILHSIIRIAPDDRLRRALRWLSYFFLLAIVVHGLVFIIPCAQDPFWQHPPVPICALPRAVPIYQVAGSILADLFLVFIPIRILDTLKSASILRRRLKMIFSATLVISVCDIVTSVVTLQLGGGPQVISALTEEFLSVVICNLTIIITAIYHFFNLDIGLNSGASPVSSSIMFKNKVSSGENQLIGTGAGAVKNPKRLSGGGTPTAIFSDQFYPSFDLPPNVLTTTTTLASPYPPLSSAHTPATAYPSSQLITPPLSRQSESDGFLIRSPHPQSSSSSSPSPPRRSRQQQRQQRVREKHTSSFRERWRSMDVDRSDIEDDADLGGSGRHSRSRSEAIRRQFVTVTTEQYVLTDLTDNLPPPATTSSPFHHSSNSRSKSSSNKFWF